MKNLLALAAIVLCLLVAYQMHRDRLAAAQKAAEAMPMVEKKPLSQYLEPHRKDLFSPLDERKAVDLVPPLEQLRQNVAARRSEANASGQAICDAGLAALDQMLAAARHRTQALNEILQLAARPTSSLERADSSHTSSSFFKNSALRNAQQANARFQPPVEQALARLHRLEAEIVSARGAEAAQGDYGQRRMSTRYVRADAGSGPANPLERGAYNQRQVIVPLKDRMQQQQGSGSGSY